MFKIIIITLTFIFHLSFLNAEVVKEIKISGNTRVSDETIKIYGDIKLNQDYNEQQLNKIINNLYSTNFFENIEISLINNILQIKLVEYPVINQLVIIGEKSNKYKEQIRKLIKLKEKDSFILNNLKDDVETIKQLYSSLGFNFTKVESQTKEIDKNNLDLIFKIEKGEEALISKILFTGDKKIRERRLKDVIASEEHKFWKFISRNTKFRESLVNLDVRLLKNYYKSLGYYDVQVKSSSAEVEQKNNIVLTYSIDAGNRYIIKKITTNVDPVFDKNLFYPLNKEYQKITGDYYSPFKIKKLLEKIDELIEFNNLQFVEHNVEEIVEDNSISIKFNISEGKKILVERINILGNTVTNESVIRGELLLDEGDPFTNLNLEKSVAEIKARKIFKTVKSNVVSGSSEDQKIIDIIVEEQPTGEISAGAGVGTDGGTIAFSIQENNWLGEGKKVGLDVQIETDSLTGTIDFTDPNYNFLGNSINYYVSSTTNDKPDQGYENTLMQAGVQTGFEQFQDVFATLGLSASYDDLQTTDSASESLKKQAGQFSELAANYGFSFDRRNRAFMPTDGYITKFNQSFPVFADRNFISNSFSSSIYQQFSENVIGAV